MAAEHEPRTSPAHEPASAGTVLVGLVYRGGSLRPGSVAWRAGTVAPPEPDFRRIELPEDWIAAPGFVDLQVNGFAGEEIGDGPGAHAAIARALTAEGVTAFCPTLVSRRDDEYEAAARALELTGWPADGARSLGVHLEGPLLSPVRRGAHAEAVITAAEPRVVDRLAARFHPSIVTLAPERDGAIDLIRSLTARGVIVSMGHTEASPAAVAEAASAGATMVTHAMNAMPGITARDPGPLGAALADHRVRIAVIADGVHLDPLVLRMVARLAGPRLVAVSDAVSAAGATGTHRLTGAGPIRRAGDRVLDQRGTLAGSAFGLGGAARRLREAGLTDARALAAVCDAPRRVLGLPDGLAAGTPADLVVLDGELVPRATLIGGQLAWGTLP